jgi:hypothetical protein
MTRPRTLAEAMGMTPAEIAELRARCERLARIERPEEKTA